MRPIYLAGPIQGRTDSDCRLWREQATALTVASTLPRRDWEWTVIMGVGLNLFRGR